MKSYFYHIAILCVFFLPLSSHSQVTFQIDFSDIPQLADSQCVFYYNFDTIYDPIFENRKYDFLLPPDADLETVKFSLYNTKTTKINKVLTASPGPIMRNLTEAEIEENIKIGEYFYTLNEFIPSSNMFTHFTGMGAQYKIATVALTPVRYNPLKKEVEILNNGTLAVTFDVIPDFKCCFRKRDPEYEQSLKSLIDNDTALFELYETDETSIHKFFKTPNTSICNKSILFMGKKLHLNSSYQGVNKKIEVFSVSGKLIQEIITRDNIVDIIDKRSIAVQTVLLAKITILP